MDQSSVIVRLRCLVRKEEPEEIEHSFFEFEEFDSVS